MNACRSGDTDYVKNNMDKFHFCTGMHGRGINEACIANKLEIINLLIEDSHNAYCYMRFNIEFIFCGLYSYKGDVMALFKKIMNKFSVKDMNECYEICIKMFVEYFILTQDFKNKAYKILFESPSMQADICLTHMLSIYFCDCVVNDVCCGSLHHGYIDNILNNMHFIKDMWKCILWKCDNEQQYIKLPDDTKNMIAWHHNVIIYKLTINKYICIEGFDINQLERLFFAYSLTNFLNVDICNLIIKKMVQ